MTGDIPPRFRLGSRGSNLARWQTAYVAGCLQRLYPALQIESMIFTTRGDRVIDRPLPEIGGKGLFTLELEKALLDGTIDGAVHSLKDLPTLDSDGLTIGAIPARGDVRDVLISREGHSLQDLAAGAVIGTSSRRRAAQLRRARPDINIRDIRGNVETRIAKTLDPSGPYDGTILAYAGVERLGMTGSISQVLATETMLPSPGQAALAVQCRTDRASLTVLATLADETTTAAVEAERAFLAALDGGCSVPVAALATVTSGHLFLHGRVVSLDGTLIVDVQGDGPVSDRIALGTALAEEARERGADRILAHLVEQSPFP